MKNFFLFFLLLISSIYSNEKGKRLFIEISPLLWQSKEGNLEYAAKDKKTNISSTETRDKVSVVIPDFGWRGGVKVSLGYFFKDFDSRAIWTYYKGEFTHVKKHPNVELTPEGNGVIPLYYYNFFYEEMSPEPRYTNATGDFTLHFDSIDLEGGKNISLGEKFILKILFGAKCAIINQNYKIFYKNGNRLSNETYDVTLEKSTIHFKNNSLGLGPFLGFDTKITLKRRYLFLLSSYFCTLATKFDVKRDQNDVVFDHDDLTTKNLNLILKDDFFKIKPMIRLLLGFGWEKNIKKQTFSFSLNYEMQYFWGQNQTRRFVSDSHFQTYSNSGDLQMQGLTTKIGCKF